MYYNVIMYNIIFNTKIWWNLMLKYVFLLILYIFVLLFSCLGIFRIVLGLLFVISFCLKFNVLWLIRWPCLGPCLSVFSLTVSDLLLQADWTCKCSVNSYICVTWHQGAGHSHSTERLIGQRNLQSSIFFGQFPRRRETCLYIYMLKVNLDNF